MDQILAIADDLSGAMESTSVIKDQNSKIWLSNSVKPDLSRLSFEDSTVMLDLDSRYAEPYITELSYIKILNHFMQISSGKNCRIYLKIDSLLRGNVFSVVSSAHKSGLVFFAPSLPQLNRIVKNGRPIVEGIHLHESNDWHNEFNAPPESIIELLSPIPCEIVSLSEIRGAEEVLRKKISLIFQRKAVAVFDAETDEDLTIIANQSSNWVNSIVIGSSGIALALGKLLIKMDSYSLNSEEKFLQKDIIGIIGSASQKSREQLKFVENSGITTGYVSLKKSSLSKNKIEKLLGTKRITVIGVRKEEPAMPQNRQIIEVLAHSIFSYLASASLILSGGETARVVLNQLSVAWVKPIRSISYGVVLAKTDQGQLIAVKPGMFGTLDALVEMIKRVKELTSREVLGN
jgi:4-hydroxythreonine-4-phosphate dehydrogenase